MISLCVPIIGSPLYYATVNDPVTGELMDSTTIGWNVPFKSCGSDFAKVMLNTCGDKLFGGIGLKDFESTYSFFSHII